MILFNLATLAIAAVAVIYVPYYWWTKRKLVKENDQLETYNLDLHTENMELAKENLSLSKRNRNQFITINNLEEAIANPPIKVKVDKKFVNVSAVEETKDGKKFIDVKKMIPLKFKINQFVEVLYGGRKVQGHITKMFAKPVKGYIVYKVKGTNGKEYQAKDISLVKTQKNA